MLLNIELLTLHVEFQFKKSNFQSVYIYTNARLSSNWNEDAVLKFNDLHINDKINSDIKNKDIFITASSGCNFANRDYKKVY